MKTGDALSLSSQIINLIIFIYFAIILLKTNSLDLIGLFISAFGLLSSIIAILFQLLKIVNNKKTDIFNHIY